MTGISAGKSWKNEKETFRTIWGCFIFAVNRKAVDRPPVNHPLIDPIAVKTIIPSVRRHGIS
jgi:hypothetical protein